jgi:hypothetical protein
MSNSQEKRVALVTGSTSGIGKAIAKRLAEDGFNIAFHSKSSIDLDVEDIDIKITIIALFLKYLGRIICIFCISLFLIRCSLFPVPYLNYLINFVHLLTVTVEGGHSQASDFKSEERVTLFYKI